MLLLTTETLPPHLAIREVFSMVLANVPIEISDKGPLRNALGSKRNEWRDAIQLLAAQAPPTANAIIGIRFSTAAQNFSNGTFLYLTIAGTPVLCGEA